MIKIIDKTQCCGCHACVQCCPKQCIIMHEDGEGFLYPKVDTRICIECGLCEKVCPVIQQGAEHTPLVVYASLNKEESVRSVSSSGGMFTPLAEQVLKEGGVVFGARFDEKWEVVHDYTEQVEGLAAFRGSKYVQSRIGDSYRKAEHFLRVGRKVLFSGTPCQIAGLKRYLRKEYDNLLAVDILCHGVPSPKVWRRYLHELNGMFFHNKEIQSIGGVNFRDKRTGWRQYTFSVVSAEKTSSGMQEYAESYYRNIFMQGFLADLYLRPSCYACPSKKGKSGSDLTIADYWGVRRVLPEIDDDKGVGLVLVNTDKGRIAYQGLDMQSYTTDYEMAQMDNGGFKEKVAIHPDRSYFFKKLDCTQRVSKLIHSCVLRPQLPKRKRILLLIKRYIMFGL